MTPTFEDFWCAMEDQGFALTHVPTFLVTWHFREDYPEWQPPRWYKLVWHDFDRDCYIYAHDLYAPFVHLYHWWLSVRWRGEWLLAHYGITQGEDGSHVGSYRFTRWDFWRSRNFQYRVFGKLPSRGYNRTND